MQNISFELKEKIDNYYKKSNSVFAYTSFVGVQLFQDDYDQHFCELKNNAFVVSYEKGKTQNPTISVPYFCSKKSEDLSELKNFVKENEIQKIEYLNENEAKFLEKSFDIYETDERNFEAIYPIERFQTFQGLKRKKSIVNHFIKNYSDFRLEVFDNKFYSEILSLLEYRQGKTKHPSYYFEESGIRFLMDNYGKIQTLIGFVLLVGNKIVGFMFGEFGNDSTLLNYFMKADVNYKGAYLALQHLISKSPELEKIKTFNYTNLTQIQGIKEMKLQLQPEKLLKSYVALPKKNFMLNI